MAFTALLPVEALALHYASKAVNRAKDDRRALSSLIKKGEITEEDLRSVYDGYPGKERLQLAEGELSGLMEASLNPGAKLDPESARKTAGLAASEFQDFQRYLVKEYRKEINEEKADQPESKPLSFRESLSGIKQYYKQQYVEDKVGTSLRMGITGGSLAAGIAAVADAFGAAGAGAALDVLIPGLGILGIASGVHGIRKALENPKLNKVEKALDVIQNGSSIVGSAGLVTGQPIVMLGGLAGSLSAIAVKYIYHKYVEWKKHRAEAARGEKPSSSSSARLPTGPEPLGVPAVV